MPADPSVFVKRCGPGREEGEAAGLDWLRGAEPSGGVRVARVLARHPGRGELDLERITEGPASPAAARRFGRALARTHAAGAGWFGCGPAERVVALFVHDSPLALLTRDEAPASWGAFYAEHRLRPFLREAVDAGALAGDGVRLLDRVVDRVASGAFDSPQPALVTTPAARTHGDLWAGNVLWSADPDEPTGAVLIDPFAHGAHAETDLALLAVFGLQHLGAVLAAYDDESPLADGWRDRVGVHQLFPLLFHTAHFGGSYGARTVEVARRCA